MLVNNTCTTGNNGWINQIREMNRLLNFLFYFTDKAPVNSNFLLCICRIISFRNIKVHLYFLLSHRSIKYKKIIQKLKFFHIKAVLKTVNQVTHVKQCVSTHVVSMATFAPLKEVLSTVFFDFYSSNAPQHWGHSSQSCTESGN